MDEVTVFEAGTVGGNIQVALVESMLVHGAGTERVNGIYKAWTTPATDLVYFQHMDLPITVSTDPTGVGKVRSRQSVYIMPYM